MWRQPMSANEKAVYVHRSGVNTIEAPACLCLHSDSSLANWSCTGNQCTERYVLFCARHCSCRGRRRAMPSTACCTRALSAIRIPRSQRSKHRRRHAPRTVASPSYRRSVPRPRPTTRLLRRLSPTAGHGNACWSGSALSSRSVRSRAKAAGDRAAGTIPPPLRRQLVVAVVAAVATRPCLRQYPYQHPRRHLPRRRRILAVVVAMMMTTMTTKRRARAAVF